MSLIETSGQLSESDVKIATLYQISQQETPYQELEIFRRDWEAHRKDATLHSYRLDRKIQIDRLIFFGFSIFFFLLGVMIFFKTANWACAAYFSNCQSVKAIACTLCLILSASAFWVGAKLCARKHSINELASKAKQDLTRWYRQKRAELRLHAADSEENKRVGLFFKQTYHKALDLILESKDEALRLIDHIAHWPGLTLSERETLFSQTLFELNDKINQSLNRLKQISVKNPAGAS